jgi:hypothetical protein
MTAGRRCGTLTIAHDSWREQARAQPHRAGVSRALAVVGAAALAALWACAGGRPSAPVPTPAPAPSALELPGPSSPGRPETLLLVAISGLAADAWAGGPPAMPTLARLAAAGVAAARVEAPAPPARAPAHATLATGRRPASHRIASDLLIGERGVRREGYTHASQLRGPTLASAAAEAGRSAAAIGWPATVGAAIAFLLPDVEPARRGASWLDELGDKATPWLVERARAQGAAAPAAAAPGAERDAVLVTVACDVLRSPAPPTLLLLHLGQVAAAAERAGPDGPEARAALAQADAELARLLGCLREAGRLDTAALLVAGDRGLAPVHTRISANSLLEREGLLARDGEGSSLQSWQALARSNGGSAFVYARGEGDALRARSALRAEAQRTGVFRVIAAQDMLEDGADPEAWFGLEARPGYVFDDSADGPLLAPTPLAAAGGWLDDDSAPSPAFVAFGRGVRRGVRIPWMRQTDVAPTAARLLGLRLDEAEGHALVGALELPAEAPAPPRVEEGAGGD